MKKNLSWRKQALSNASAWEFVLGACIGINLIRYHSVDIFFVLFALMVIVKLKSAGIQTVLEDLYLKRNVLTLLVITFFIGCSAGYLQFWPLNEEQISDIMELRWILGLYCCIYAGSQVGKRSSNFLLKSILPLVTVSFLLYLQSKGPFGIVDIRNRMLGLYENPNHLGMASLLIWAVYLGFLAFETKIRSKPFLVHCLTFLALSMTIVATYSRSSWLGCLAALVVAILYTRHRLLTAAAGLGLIASTYFIAMNSLGLKDRLLTTDFSSTGVESGRIAIWKVSWQIFLDYPIFGVGIDQGKRIFQEYYESMGIPLEYLVGHAHNQYFQMLAGSGLVGFFSYIGLFILAIGYFHKVLRSDSNSNLKQVALAGTLLIVALFASSFTDAPFRLQECRNYVILYLGFAFGYIKEKSKIT